MIKKNIVVAMSALSLCFMQPVCALERILSTEQTNNSATSSATNSSINSAMPLTAGAREAAQLLGLMPLVQRLQESKLTGDPALMSDEQMAIRVHLLDRILEESLEVRVVADRIDRELAWAYTGKGMLEARRQKRLNYLFTANFMQGGILGILAGPMFLNKQPTAGAELLLIGSSVGLLLSTLALVESRSGTKKIDGEVTVLADVYELNQSGTKQHEPAVVMKFFNSVPPNSLDHKTRREVLIDGWKRGKYLRDTSEKHLDKLAAINPPGAKYKENIGLLGDRIRMLYDVQWTIEQLDAELLDLMRATR